MQVESRQSSFTREELLACAHGTLFNKDSGRLPLPNMLMFDRVTHIDLQGGAYGKGIVEAELDIRPDLWFFGCHFENDPVMPGCLGLDALWQLLGFFLTWLGEPGCGRALGAGSVRFSGQVLPSAHRVAYKVDIKRVMRSKLAIAIGDGQVYVDGCEIYNAQTLRVGLFNARTLI